MRIVPQSASASYSYFSAAQLLLSAPRIAGLLPARVTSTAVASQVTVIKPRESLLDRQRAIWAAQDAELDAFLDGARQRLTTLYTEVMQESAARSARPYSGRSHHE